MFPERRAVFHRLVEIEARNTQGCASIDPQAVHAMVLTSTLRRTTWSA